MSHLGISMATVNIGFGAFLGETSVFIEGRHLVLFRIITTQFLDGLYS